MGVDCPGVVCECVRVRVHVRVHVCVCVYNLSQKLG